MLTRDQALELVQEMLQASAEIDELPQLVQVRRVAKQLDMSPRELLALWSETDGPGTYRVGKLRRLVDLAQVRRWLTLRFELPTDPRQADDPWANGGLRPLGEALPEPARPSRGSSAGSSRASHV